MYSQKWATTSKDKHNKVRCLKDKCLNKDINSRVTLSKDIHRDKFPNRDTNKVTSRVISSKAICPCSPHWTNSVRRPVA